MHSNFRIIFDTNILVSSISSYSSTRWIFDAILNGKISIILNNEIIFEYVEVLSKKSTQQIANNIIRVLLYHRILN